MWTQVVSYVSLNAVNATKILIFTMTDIIFQKRGNQAFFFFAKQNNISRCQNIKQFVNRKVNVNAC